MFLARGTIVGSESGASANIVLSPKNDELTCSNVGGANAIQTGMEQLAVESNVSSGGSSGSISGASINADASTPSVPYSPSPDSEKSPKKIRVLFCGTHPQQYNGYSKVVNEMAKRIAKKEDIDLTIYGFQNFQQTRTHREPIEGVKVHSALDSEEPKRGGFGEKEVGAYLKANPQDVVIIYNDMAVTTLLAANIVETFKETQSKEFALVSYIDQVYLNQKRKYIKLLNDHFQHIIAFTDYWGKIVREQGIDEKIPIDVFPHGFDPDLFYPISKKLARIYFQVPQDAFVVLNMNRNQPRKRWDHCIMAYAEVVKKHQQLMKAHPERKYKPIKFLIGTALNACWELPELFLRELKKRGLKEELVNDYLVAISKPQQLTDKEVNIVYNAADIGVNTCDGEGYGLCNFEMAAVGNPQVVPKLGGFREFFNDQNALLVDTKWNYVVSNDRDAVGGEAECSDPADFANAIWKYYQNPSLMKKHGKKAREDILTNYHWDDVVNHFHRVIHKIHRLHLERNKKND